MSGASDFSNLEGLLAIFDDDSALASLFQSNNTALPPIELHEFDDFLVPSSTNELPPDNSSIQSQVIRPEPLFTEANSDDTFSSYNAPKEELTNVIMNICINKKVNRHNKINNKYPKICLHRSVLIDNTFNRLLDELDENTFNQIQKKYPYWCKHKTNSNINNHSSTNLSNNAPQILSNERFSFTKNFSTNEPNNIVYSAETLNMAEQNLNGVNTGEISIANLVLQLYQRGTLT